MVLSQTSPGDYHWFWLVGGGTPPNRLAEWEENLSYAILPLIHGKARCN